MNKNIELMKKLIEEKKNKSNKNNNKRAVKSMGKTSKGVRVGNGGGLFDK